MVASVAERREALLATLDEQIRAIERELKGVVQQDAGWAATAARLLTIPGVGLLTAAWLLVTTLNFTVGATAEELTAYAGLAPMAHESGTRVRDRPRIGHCGNGRLRTALYLATLSAAQPGDPSLLRAPARGRQAEEGRPPRRSPQALAPGVGDCPQGHPF